MAAVYTDYGERVLLHRATASTFIARGWAVNLFINNRVPLPTDEYDPAIEALYDEATFPGYAFQLLTNFSVPQTIGGTARSTANELVFTSDGLLVTAQTCYGYWVDDTNDGNKVLWAELFPSGPIVFEIPFRTHRISPTVEMRNASG